MNFAANISTMFQDLDLDERFNEARESGFKFVEAQVLYDYPIDVLKSARETAGVDVVLINTPIKGKRGDSFEGQTFGLACIPGEEVEFINLIHNGIKYANELRCKQIHIIAGLKPQQFSMEDLERTYVENLKVAAEILEEHDIVGVIEPICAQVKANYFLDSFEKAIKYIEDVSSSHLKLLLDVFHLHNLEQNVEKGLRKYLPFAAHVQISQAPNRNEPFAEGEINYKKVFQVIKESPYNGYIGLEYTPSDDTDFKWMEEYEC